jgi:hypothetical protein
MLVAIGVDWPVVELEPGDAPHPEMSSAVTTTTPKRPSEARGDA